VTHVGFDIEAAPEGDWRDYDRENPDPGYYQFDWLSARHPDLYHRFSLTSTGAMAELATLVDLTDLVVVDVGAGTGRATLAAAAVAARVYAVDAYASVLEYNARLTREAGFTNVEHLRGDRSALPLDDGVADAVIASMAGLDHREAARVLKPGGFMAYLGLQEAWFAGELTTAFLGPTVPEIDVDAPAVDTVSDEQDWHGVRTLDGVHHHDFPYVATYDSVEEAVAIIGRLMGPEAAAYLAERKQRTVAWGIRISWARVP
jgi:ubiquinone/menaquinone biosynthesis C-methylase UbiE